MPLTLFSSKPSTPAPVNAHIIPAKAVKEHLKRSSQKSCFRCVEKKMRCNRETPCAECLRSQGNCEYPSQDTVDPWTSRDEVANTPKSVPCDQRYDDHYREPTNSRNTSWSPSFTRMRVLDSGPTEALSKSTSLDIMNPMDGSFANQQYDWPSGDSPMSSSIGTSQTFDPLSIDIGMVEDSFATSPTSMSLMQPSFRTGGFNWLDFDQDFVTGNLELHPVTDINESQPWPPSANQQITAIETTTSFVGAPLAGNTGRSRNSQREECPEKRNTLAWPFDQANNSLPHRYQLPPLSAIVDDVWLKDQPNPAQATLIQGFIDVLSQRPLPELTSLQNSNSIHALCELKRLVDSYFARFHDVQAIIHRPTWSMSSCPPALLIAVACMGALLSDNPSDKNISVALSDICSAVVTWTGASDANNYSDISYLNAHCLYQIYCLGSGKRQLYQDADRSRGLLIGGLRGIGLLKPRSAVGLVEIQDHLPVSGDERAIYKAWREWVTQESGRRAAWAAFEYDCSLCTLTSRRGVVDLSELPSLLPCPDSIWNATSAQAWLALMSRLEPDNSRPNTSVLLKLALAGRELPPYLGSWAKRLCSQILGRLLWDLWQLEVVAMPEYLGLSSIVTAHEESKRSLLKGLNNLVSSLAAPSSTSDLVSYNITSLLCHYSHLCSANGILDLILYIVRTVISSEPQENNGLEVARTRLRMTFNRDSKTARRLCWHAAQIVATANEYLVSAPCEIMRVFMGYVFLMSYATYGHHQQASVKNGNQSFRLDLHDDGLSRRRDVVRWIESGGPASAGSVQDIGAGNCVPTISQNAQEMLKRLSCWGLAHKFTRIFQALERNGI
ncbi:hypothetical protein FLONG3_400 [Fusarium longipes]|uniref:Zn(2)-C6 fungal-type domain-containing protein n=1 Tax=Fusarium longipes TaxID=694270 RepID=A0A395TAX1_9HYPO|nr:hypothetical protein FLONG3_400 [Fusarium longipes]